MTTCYPTSYQDRLARLRMRIDFVLLRLGSITDQLRRIQETIDRFDPNEGTPGPRSAGGER